MAVNYRFRDTQGFEGREKAANIHGTQAVLCTTLLGM